MGATECSIDAVGDRHARPSAQGLTFSSFSSKQKHHTPVVHKIASFVLYTAANKTRKVWIAFSLSACYSDHANIFSAILQAVRGARAIGNTTPSRTAIQKAFEYFQDKTWDFGYKSGKRTDSVALKRSLNEFGHLPPWYKAWKGDEGQSKRLLFTANDDECLQRIIKEQPQLYLDEIVTEMKKLTGKIWHPSTLRKRMHKLGYSLKVAVHRARQASENEQALSTSDSTNPCRILNRHSSTSDSTNPCQILNRYFSLTRLTKVVMVVDDVVLGKKKGIATVIPSYFEEDFLQQFTFIDLANIFGFVPEACEIVHQNKRLEN
ncbi:unnamed protein product [Cylindrotheca closterium]|uniref:Uncharacterized protein n=1 Tax=Cylindrotheca closterium TaxID=2856 RepID=A0AAD2CFJ3_9STRA|nr:unnamed protein product [Cylindrotheca closterium]